VKRFRILALMTAMTVTGLAPAGAASGPAAAVIEAESRRIAVMDKAKDAVLAIFAADGKGGGSAVVVTPDGYALTNFHVVQPLGVHMKCGMADGKVYDAVVVGVDPTGDLAVIKLFGRDDFPHATMGDSDRLRAGDSCFAMGNPFLLAADFRPTATWGIVSGVHRYQYPSGTTKEYTDCIQTDASINPGNSGGPLFDDQGRLIGINGRASFEKRGRVNVGVAYAISINQVKNFMGYLRSGRVVDHATLGARVAFDEDGSVVVSDIMEQSDAYRRGLRYDDEIVSFAGRTITTPNGFKNVLGILPKGWRVPLSYRRDGERRDVLVRLRGVHRTAELTSAVEQEPLRRPPAPKPPAPKPDDKPEPDREKPGDGKHPPQMVVRPRPPLPDIVKKHFEKKHGYSNYYFNKLNRQRVWDAWVASGDFARLDGNWTLGGRLPGGGELELQLDGQGVVLKLPTVETKWFAADGIATLLVPPQSGGLLPTLHLWRRLAVEGPEKFGDVYYQGTAPLLGHERWVDVLVGLHGGVECRFMFDPQSGLLLAIEMFPEDDVDPCEIYFSDYSEQHGHLFPGRIEARFGDDEVAVFELEGFEFKSLE